MTTWLVQGWNHEGKVGSSERLISECIVEKHQVAAALVEALEAGAQELIAVKRGQSTRDSNKRPVTRVRKSTA